MQYTMCKIGSKRMNTQKGNYRTKEGGKILRNLLHRLKENRIVVDSIIIFFVTFILCIPMFQKNNDIYLDILLGAIIGKLVFKKYCLTIYMFVMYFDHIYHAITFSCPNILLLNSFFQNRIPSALMIFFSFVNLIRVACSMIVGKI